MVNAQLPTVHVGMVTYNSRAELPDCLGALSRQTYPALRLTVLDNASADESAGWVALHAPAAALIRSERNVGFGQAHNRIVQTCALQPDDFYLPLNPDVTLAPTYIAALVALAQETGAGWVTGKLLLPGEPPTLYSAGHALRRDGYAFNIGHGLRDEGQFGQPREVFGAPGAAPLISQRLIAAIAPEGRLFDADMFLYGEDTDLDWRARRQGWRCWYTPHAVAWHRGSRAAEPLRVQAVANRYLSVIKNAYLIDLFSYNLPVIGLHCALRLALTPRLGLRLIGRLAWLGPRFWRRRQRPAVPRAVMLAWFRWSRAQPTGQRVTFRARFAAVLRGAHRRSSESGR